MRPTREGRETPLRSGLVTVGVGVDPGPVTEDPEPPDDRASSSGGGQAFIPATVDGTEELLTGKTVTVGASGASAVTPANPERSNDRDYDTKSQRNSGAESGTTSWWWAVDLGAAATVTSIEVDESDVTNWILPETGTFIERSDDGSAWTAESYTYSLSVAGSPALTDRHTYTLDTPSMHRYWRVRKQVGAVFHSADAILEWYINGSVVEEVVWIDAPLTIDDDDATNHYVLEDAIDATSGAFWRGTLLDSYLIASIEAEIAFEDAGATTVLVQAGNASDYSDAATVATISLTATGSYTADTLAASWVPTAVYRYWQLVLDTAVQGIHVHEVSLFDPPTFTGAHGDLTGRDVAEQHPASAVTVTPFSTIAATDVQAALEEIVAEGTSAGTITPFDLGSLGATETIDADNGEVQRGDLDDDCAIDATGFTVDEYREVVLKLTTASPGGFAITWDAAIIFADGADDQPGQDTGDVTWFVLWSDAGDSSVFAIKVGAGGTGGGVTDHDSLTGVSADDHHNQAHALVGADHTASGLTTGHVLTATGATSFTFAAPSFPVADWILVDAGTPTYDATGDPVVVTVETVFGIDGSNVPYYDATGAVAGEEAALYWDPTNSVYQLRPYNFP